MTVRTGGLLASLGLLVALAACTNTFEIPVETPIKPKLDVTPFQRVLVVGFISGGTEEVDANQETVRLLRSQLRTKSGLRVIDADILPLTEIAQEQVKGPLPVKANDGNQPPAANIATPPAQQDQKPAAPPTPEVEGQKPATPDSALPKRIKDEKDLEAYDQIFANVDFWKKLGEEFQSPLIVTGTVLFTPLARSGFVTSEQEAFLPDGRRIVQPVRAYRERKGFILRPKFIFIDGRTGTTLYSETQREEILYDAQQNTPALSSYFELMDRIIPAFLGTLSSQKIKGTRILMK